MSKLVTKIIPGDTRQTYKIDIGLARNKTPRIVGPRKNKYHSPLTFGEWFAFTNYPWGRGLINFLPEEEALAVET